MNARVDLRRVYAPSKDVVARDIEGEFMLIPITSGVGDLEGAVFSLNRTGRALWEQIDGKKNLEAITEKLISEFDGFEEKIRKDVLAITEELLNIKMLVEVK